MARFRRLTVDEARAMTRAELLDRLEIEQQYWHRKMDQHRMGPADWEAHKVYTECLHMIDPAEAVSDTLAWLKGEGPGRYMDTRPGDADRSASVGDPEARRRPAPSGQPCQRAGHRPPPGELR